MTESFEGAIAFARAIMADCDAPILDRLQRAHDHEIEQLRRLRFREGYEAGQRSMDAEHYHLKLRLQGLRFGDGSHENLSRLAYAIYPCPTGWGKESCEGLRDKIIEMLGGVHDDPAPTAATCGACDADCDCHNQQPQAVAYDELGNERHKAVCALRKLPDDIGKSELMYQEAEHMIYAALGVEKELLGFYKGLDEFRDRLIHLLGGDEPTAMEYIQRIVSEHDIKCLDMELSGVELSQASVDAMSRRADQSHEPSPTSLENETGITDELRKFVAETWDGSMYVNQIPKNLQAIADRIDEQFNRICEQQEAVLQKTIDTMVDERDELQEKLDSAMAKNRRLITHIDQMQGGSRRWRDECRKLKAERDQLQAKLDEYEHADAAEDIVRDMHLGKVTDSQAVERIRALP